MASTSRLKKRKFEEKKTNVGRTGDINLGNNENGSMRSSLDGSERHSGKSIQTRCSPTRFVTLCKKLKDQLLTAVKEMGFSSLLEMSSCTIFLPLVEWLIENFDVEDASLNVHGKSFILTPLLFETVIGVKDGGDDFEQEGSTDDVKRRRDAVRNGKATLSLTQLEENLIEAESVDDLFVSRFVLFAVGSLLMPTTSVCVGTSIVSCINGLKSVRQKNWATKSFTYLVDSIRDFKEKKGAFVGGCVLFLQVFYLHHLEGHNQYIDRSMLPIAAWTEKKSKDVVSWVNNKGSGYIRMRGLDDGCCKCQFMHDDMVYMRIQIEKLTSEIQELKQQQSNREDVNKSNGEGIAGESGGGRIERNQTIAMDDDEPKGGSQSLSADYWTDVNMSDGEGIAGESGSGRIERNHIIVLDDDEPGGGSQRLSTDSSNVILQADSIYMYNDFVSSGGLKIGPFKLTKSLSEPESKLAFYVLDDSHDKRELLARFGSEELDRDSLLSIRPAAEVYDWVMNAYAYLLTQYEIPKNRQCWFLPTSLSFKADYLKLEGLLKYMDIYNSLVEGWRKYFGNFLKCTKIIIPVFSQSGMGCKTAVVNLKKENVVLWDSMAAFRDESVDRKFEGSVKEMLRILDHLLADKITRTFPKGLSLQSFKVTHERYVQQQDKRYDCIIYTMKHMWAASQGLDSIPEFDPDEFRFQVAIELVNSGHNSVRASVLKKCSSHFDLLVRNKDMVESGMRHPPQ